MTRYLQANASKVQERMKKQSKLFVFLTLAVLSNALSDCSAEPSSSTSTRFPLSTFTPTYTATAASTLAPRPTSTLFGGGTGRIAYVSCNYKSISEGTTVFEVTDDDSCEIYLMNTDGSDKTNLTNNSVFDANPTPSPDGAKIAYVSGQGYNAEIYVMNTDGSSKAQLTDNSDWDTEPAWSPDGLQLVFVTDHFDNSSEIKIMNADGSGQTTLAKSGASEGYYLSPDWSPLGTQIAFVREGYDLECQGCSEIFVMNVDGSNSTQITNNNGSSQNPTWSPDGAQIAYATYVEPTDIGIFSIHPDGTGQSQLADTEGWDSQPSWSPDARVIAFQSDLGQFVVGTFDIYIVGTDGSGLTRLTTNENSISPVWLQEP